MSVLSWARFAYKLLQSYLKTMTNGNVNRDASSKILIECIVLSVPVLLVIT